MSYLEINTINQDQFRLRRNFYLMDESRLLPKRVVIKPLLASANALETMVLRYDHLTIDCQSQWMYCKVELNQCQVDRILLK